MYEVLLLYVCMCMCVLVCRRMFVCVYGLVFVCECVYACGDLLGRADGETEGWRGTIARLELSL